MNYFISPRIGTVDKCKQKNTNRTWPNQVKKYLQANTKRTKLGQAGSSQGQVLEFPAGRFGYRLQIDVSNHACEHETNLIVSETLVKFVSNASQLGVLVTAYSFLDCFESVPRYSKQNRHSLMVERCSGS